ncbi:MurR/RpiR family transcriptional regulator [Salibacterium halotolerans]|uniref:DNA-binding transcriptional regulator, MurR/RpiR family, contains HTH and SIS domains n=1 Tax=Salibacterium halotolerans TaxID=1884432 RepID=A0A1I5LA98_9BACI|nr:MurR/RpiR family transcriptional regulator [Salibacterium halotolerans]SFO94145.1 DNA-binding transcriptional regulator, MurR/RpiR family, contains HTH and SIS domains [Salibacterium halotolerans]
MTELNVNAMTGLLTRIEYLLPKLKGAEKKLADFITHHHEKIIHQSITELAERSNTSESTVVRFCKKLGYKGFQDLKINLAREIIKPEQHIHEVIEPEDDVVTIKKKIFQSNIQALYDSMEICSDEELERAIEAVAFSKNVEFYGVGGSGNVAVDAQHKFLKVGIKCYAYTDVALQSMSASVLTPDDAVIGISHTGSHTDTLHALKLAKEQGAVTISITNFSKSPITKIADINLYTTSKETMFRTDATASRIAQLTIVDTLFTGVANRNYEDAYTNIQKTRDSTSNKRL